MSDAMTDPRAEEVLSFWFGDDPAQPLANSPRWFERSDASIYASIARESTF